MTNAFCRAIIYVLGRRRTRRFTTGKGMKVKISRIVYIILLLLADTAAVFCSATLSYIGSVPNGEFVAPVWIWIGCNAVFAVAIFLLFGLYGIVFSNFGLPEVLKTALASILLCVANVGMVIATDGLHITLATAIFYGLFLFLLATLVRSSKRILCFAYRYIKGINGNGKRVMLVGAGDAGATIVQEMQRTSKIEYEPVCMLDDDPEKHGKFIRGVKIVGGVADVEKYAKKYAVEEILVTMPSVSKKRVSEIVRLCQACNLPVKILPGIYQLVNGDVAVSQLREVEVQDLLGREQVCVNLNEIMGYIENKTVLVTGGGGSIGSELCRQIASHNPKTLIILDVYENNAYEIEQELKRKKVPCPILTLIASVRDKTKMRDVFEKYRPQIVFHAAAHKHVPLMETSPNEAVKNNVFGTLNVARCADEFGVETFVQISTDKAVNPTNIMGATKRICEMIVQTIGRHSAKTKFVAVRFGNVLGSNGSVIPLFKKQIAEGGPVTVTHKEIIRYFMTIPEAVSLVLQAGAYAKDGQIFVLDMGEPVRIYDLACNLIRLSGFEPNVDIDVVCTGLRPGEKLFEERLMAEEGLQKTPNGLISIAKPIELNEEKLWATLEKLETEARAESEDMKRLVKALVPTYTIDTRNSVAEALQEANQRPATSATA